jgi:hypothetical protein
VTKNGLPLVWRYSTLGSTSLRRKGTDSGFRQARQPDETTPGVGEIAQHHAQRLIGSQLVVTMVATINDRVVLMRRPRKRSKSRWLNLLSARPRRPSASGGVCGSGRPEGRGRLVAVNRLAFEQALDARAQVRRGSKKRSKRARGDERIAGADETCACRCDWLVSCWTSAVLPTPAFSAEEH